jgi:hypothetical protein
LIETQISSFKRDFQYSQVFAVMMSTQAKKLIEAYLTIVIAMILRLQLIPQLLIPLEENHSNRVIQTLWVE